MPKTYLPLPTIPLKPETPHLHPPEPPAVAHWDDSALLVMVDFKFTRAATIAPDEGIDTALLEIKLTNNVVLVVTDKEQKILGLVSAEDLLGEKPLKAIQEKRLPRTDIAVSMLMTHQRDILAFDIEELKHAKVGHIVNTLNSHRQHYALVVHIDPITGHQTARGLFSFSMISRQLGENIAKDITQAHSIAELQHDLHLND